jgi:hypothetical protein
VAAAPCCHSRDIVPEFADLGDRALSSSSLLRLRSSDRYESFDDDDESLFAVVDLLLPPPLAPRR